MRWHRSRSAITMIIVRNSDRVVTSEAEALATRRAAFGIAAVVGCDWRTAERALLHGVEAIRSRRVREEIRAQIETLQALSNGQVTSNRR